MFVVSGNELYVGGIGTDCNTDCADCYTDCTDCSSDCPADVFGNCPDDSCMSECSGD